MAGVQRFSQQLRGIRWELTLDRTPFHRRVHHTHTHAHTHSDWGSLDTPLHPVCTALEETGLPGENPHRHGGNVQTLHILSPGAGNQFVFSHQHCNEMTLSERTLEVLLQVSVTVKPNLTLQWNHPIFYPERPQQPSFGFCLWYFKCRLLRIKGKRNPFDSALFFLSPLSWRTDTSAGKYSKKWA